MPDPATTPASESSPLTPQRKRKRRSTRLQLSIPVLVYAWTAEDSPFWEITKTLSVNANGALIEMSEAVERDQMVLLVNTNTQEEQKCRVVYTGPEHGGRRKIGIEFLRSKGSFWGLVYDSERGLWYSEGPLP